VILSKLQGDVDRMALETSAAKEEASRAAAEARAAAMAARATEARVQESGMRLQPTQGRMNEATSQRMERQAAVAIPPLPVTFIRYVVNRGDTMPKIAARPEIYGDARQWTRIYEANSEVIGRDRKLQTGLVLLIVTP
jgi:nucleoid-associated protein YgaU